MMSRAVIKRCRNKHIVCCINNKLLIIKNQVNHSNNQNNQNNQKINNQKRKNNQNKHTPYPISAICKKSMDYKI